jgi:hypothetical protein
MESKRACQSSYLRKTKSVRIFTNLRVSDSDSFEGHDLQGLVRRQILQYSVQMSTITDEARVGCIQWK